MIARQKNKQSQPHHGSLNALIFCLVVLVIFLSGIAVWKRYSQRQQSKIGGTIERRIDAVTPDLNIAEGWFQTGGVRQNTTGASMHHFYCSQCRSSCLTHSRARPACPFCGRMMAQQGLRISLVGGTDTGSMAVPITIQAGARRPHSDRGVCTNCHTVIRSGALGLTPSGTAQSNSKLLWNGMTAPMITQDAVKPTLIKEFGIEVCPASGTGAIVTGVMGNSYASYAGLQAGDVIIRCNGVKVDDVEELQRLVFQAPPEADARIKILRNDRTKDLFIMVGEGEMEGFTPIQRR